MHSISSPLRSRAALLAVGVTAVGVAVPVVSSDAKQAPKPHAAARYLNGTLTIGRGSWFRMQYPGGSGYFRNPDSSARDKTYTPLSGGSAGGIRIGRFQGTGSPAFDGRGNSRAGSIVRPTKFAGVRFGLATLGRDPQSRRHAAPPGFKVVGRTIYGQTTALTATWNRLYFNQGYPKPPGTVKGQRIGRYNSRTGSYVITWKSKIRGGAFNGFTGIWRLTGKLRR